MEIQYQTEDCTELVDALEKLHKVTKRLAFYFIPEDVMREVLEASQVTEKVLQKYRKPN